MRRTGVALTAILLTTTLGCTPEPYERQLIDIVNLYRFADRVSLLEWCPLLGQAAKEHAADMATTGEFGHEGSDGSDAAERSERLGYTDWNRLGETLAVGPETPITVVDGWMNDAESRRPLVDPAFTDAGVGQATGADGRLYWVMVLGRNASVC
jgi:uncharacterized protein YkwD